MRGSGREREEQEGTRRGGKDADSALKYETGKRSAPEMQLLPIFAVSHP